MMMAGLFGSPAFASGERSNYLGAMPLFFRSGRSTFYPRAVSPRAALADLMLMFSPDRPYRWSFLALAATITGLFIWGFYQETLPPKPEREIIYIKSFPIGRKDSDIIRQQIQDLDTYETQLEAGQVESQKLADAMGIEWRKEAAENKAHRMKSMAEMKKLLEKKLDNALAKEAAAGEATAGNSAGSPGADPKAL